MRTSARTTGAVVAAAAIALLVGGCGSSDDGNSNKGDKSGGDRKKSAEPTPGGEKDEPVDKAAVPGVWTTTADGQKLTLTVVDDAASLLWSKEKKVCTGHVMKAGPDTSLVLKCPAGVGEDRSTGKVSAVSADSLKVTWNGGATDTWSKAAKAPAKLPKDPDEIREGLHLPDGLDKVTEKPHHEVVSGDKGRKVREYPGN